MTLWLVLVPLAVKVGHVQELRVVDACFENRQGIGDEKVLTDTVSVRLVLL